MSALTVVRKITGADYSIEEKREDRRYLRSSVTVDEDGRN